MSRVYKLVVFDLDGTLLNTLGDLAAAGNHALERMGRPPHPVEAYKHFVGNGIPKLIERILPADSSAEEREETYRIFNEYYSAHKSDRTVPYDGMAELVKKLTQAGVICTVNTNKAHEFSGELLKSAFGNDIRDLIGFGAGFPAKPSPEAALELCGRFSVQRSEALYVGDSSVDMQTAQNAGLDGCAVLWGFRDYEELAAYKPRYIVSSAEELYRIICG